MCVCVCVCVVCVVCVVRVLLGDGCVQGARLPAHTNALPLHRAVNAALALRLLAASEMLSLIVVSALLGVIAIVVVIGPPTALPDTTSGAAHALRPRAPLCSRGALLARLPLALPRRWHPRGVALPAPNEERPAAVVGLGVRPPLLAARSAALARPHSAAQLLSVVTHRLLHALPVSSGARPPGAGSARPEGARPLRRGLTDRPPLKAAANARHLQCSITARRPFKAAVNAPAPRAAQTVAALVLPTRLARALDAVARGNVGEMRRRLGRRVAASGPPHRARHVAGKSTGLVRRRLSLCAGVTEHQGDRYYALVWCHLAFHRAPSNIDGFVCALFKLF